MKRNRYSMNALRKQGIDPREATYLPQATLPNGNLEPRRLDPRCGRALYRAGKF